MTRNDHSNQLELSIRACSGVDSGQCDWGIRGVMHPALPYVPSSVAYLFEELDTITQNTTPNLWKVSIHSLNCKTLYTLSTIMPLLKS